ncbi:hypothetical protein EV128_116116 [Rhizobium azibense]|nr:hypothetical protein EV128_116116 [Rhizobium azibense]
MDFRNGQAQTLILFFQPKAACVGRATLTQLQKNSRLFQKRNTHRIPG